jgi:hypothetical protein
MTVAPLFFHGYNTTTPVPQENGEAMAQLGSRAVFQSRPVATLPHILMYLERRDRAILLLLDGRRTLGDVARLTRRSELEVAQTLVRLLKRGYIEFLG